MASTVEIELLMTLGCHLCDDAEAVVRRALPKATIVRIDIGDDDHDIEQYGTRIPVLRYAGNELDWPFSLLDVRGLLKRAD